MTGTLSETREMQAAQAVQITHLAEGQARIETEVKNMRLENGSQHKENGEALKRIYRLLWGILVCGFATAISFGIYMVQSGGGPYAMKGDIQHMNEMVERLERLHIQKGDMP